MKRSPFLAILLASALAPAGLAHDPAGTPKNYCEDPSEWGVHDYGPPADGTLIALGQDSNIAGDCNGDGIPADFDGHVEYALGGGWLDVDSGDGVTGGTLACYGVLGHHPFFGPISVTDEVLGTTVPFSVTADTVNLIPPTDPAAPNCGDFEADESTDCVGPCTVTFPPGLDGSYPIFVGDGATGAVGTLGHIETTTSGGGVIITDCNDGIDNDGDGGTDYFFGLPHGPWGPTDPSCDSSSDDDEFPPDGTGVGPIGPAGPAAVMSFDGSGGPPAVTSGPGWQCTGPILTGGLWEVECFPSTVLAVQGFLPACTDPWGAVGGTPVSSGTGTVRVSCKQFFGGFASASCSATWTGAGGCVAPLTGFYDFPLRCAAFVTGTTIGGNLVAACGHV